MSHHEVDARCLMCPMPVIRVQNKVADLVPGDTVEVVCTDRGALNDIPAWARINGHKLVTTAERDDEVVITIEVGEADD